MKNTEVYAKFLKTRSGIASTKNYTVLDIWYCKKYSQSPYFTIELDDKYGGEPSVLICAYRDSGDLVHVWIPDDINQFTSNYPEALSDDFMKVFLVTQLRYENV